MSATLSPPRAKVQQREPYSVGAICRARRAVTSLGGRYSIELGIDLDSDAQEVERWALAVTLFGDGISTALALRGYRVLERAGIRTIKDVGNLTGASLASLLDGAGYKRPERTISRLQTLADAVADRHGGQLSSVGAEITDPDVLERVLAMLPGWGTKPVRLFLRELRGVWPGAAPALDEHAAAAAEHARLPATLDELQSVAAAAHLDFRDLEAALARLALCHDFASCPGGEECPFLSFDPAHFVHF